MRKIIFGLFLSISIAGYAQIGEKNFIDQSYIEVTGKAEMEISPDMIYLKIVVSDKNNKSKLTLPEIEGKMISELTELGIDVNKDLSLMDFASNLKTYAFKTNDIILSKQYQLVVHDAKILQVIFFEFQKLGISDVSIEKLEHSQIEQYRKDVKVAAVKAAKEKADLLASALNQKIGKAIFVQELSNIIPKISSSNIMIRGISSLSKSVNSLSENKLAYDIEFEQIKIESSFLVRFVLE
jgi:uncharacterized protein YggE